MNKVYKTEIPQRDTRSAAESKSKRAILQGAAKTTKHKRSNAWIF